MKNRKLLNFLFIFVIFIVSMNTYYAESYMATIKGTSVRIRSGAGTNYAELAITNTGVNFKMVTNTLVKSESGCANDWYQIYFNNSVTGFICSDYVTVTTVPDDTPIISYEDKYYRPWTSPKTAIVGGAKFISNDYINAGQFTSYLKKFNVNPATNRVYNHQYMANLQAPYSEAKTSYKSYKENNLLSLPLEFTIPIFNNMPEATTLLGVSLVNTCQSEVIDSEFEKLLDAEDFDETYKCKLRLIHQKYPNWTFKALKTDLDFNASVTAEQRVSSISGNSQYYYVDGNGNYIQTESGWYKANMDTVAYFLDPRNFLVEERILMFENLSYSDNYTENVVASVLRGTFMDGYSLIDNQLYSSIFVEAGKQENVSAVYLASLARQESGTKGSKATSGNEFTYKGITYKGLYNFFNIGANSSAEIPVLAGLVWAAGGSQSVIVDGGSEAPSLEEKTILNNLGATKNSGCLTNLEIGMTISAIKTKLAGINVVVEGASDNDIIKTGQTIIISDDEVQYTYTIVVSGDVNGDGIISASDYVKIKNNIMDKSGSELNVAQSLAADLDGNGSIGATDYVKVKTRIMEG